MQILSVFKGIFFASVELFNRMSFYLLVGFLFAGIFHIFLSTERIARHLGKKNFSSVLKAAFLGIPLPLCSCGVIPAALALKNKGASRGATLSFLISTPTSGADSILATYSLMGGIFAVWRIIASFVAGTLAGIFTNLLERGKDDGEPAEKRNSCQICEREEEHLHSPLEKLRNVVNYGFGVMLSDIARWLLLGILIGGLISYLIPEHVVERYLGSSWQAMVIMLAVGIPIYVCATGSIPIASALILKGMSPGAALVFLLAGPATNMVTLTVMARFLGKKSTAIYLSAIVISSLILGRALDFIWTLPGRDVSMAAGRGGMLPLPIQYASSIILLGLLLYGFAKGHPVKGRMADHR